MAEAKTTEADRSAAPEGMSERAGIGLLVICAAQFLVALDLSIANVAVPHIREDLGFGVASIGWVLPAYALAFASLLLIARGHPRTLTRTSEGFQIIGCVALSGSPKKGRKASSWGS